MVGVQSLSAVPRGHAVPTDSCTLDVVTGKTRPIFRFQRAQATGEPQFQPN